MYQSESKDKDTYNQKINTISNLEGNNEINHKRNIHELSLNANPRQIRIDFNILNSQACNNKPYLNPLNG